MNLDVWQAWGPEAQAAWAAAAVALIGVLLTGVGAWASWAAVKVQRALARDQAQPYVWADVRCSPEHGFSLELVVGNAGPTVATDVKVTFKPQLPVSFNGADRELTQAAMRRLETGLQSLGPGRELAWTLGASSEILADSGPQPFDVRIEAVGPFGPTEPLTYKIDLSDFRESDDNPRGSLHELTQVIQRGLGNLK